MSIKLFEILFSSNVWVHLDTLINAKDVSNKEVIGFPTVITYNTI